MNGKPHWVLRVLVGLSVLGAPVGLATNPPALLSQTHLYSDIVQKKIEASNRSYEPQYPLWSDGATKKRWIYLPPNSKINTGSPSGPTSPARGNLDYWVFPVGTKFWKEFSFPRSSDGTLHRVETRLIEKTGVSSWNYATYLWNFEETEAQLAPVGGVKNYYPIKSQVSHDIPSKADCTQCHRKGGDAVLGFDLLQLSDDRDPLAPHAQPIQSSDLTLKKLDEEKLVSYLPPTVIRNPPKIISSTPEGRAVMGYLHANCGNCHNPTASAGFTYLLFRYPANTLTEASSPVFTSAVDKECYQFKIPGEPECVRFKSGHPDKSAILYRMNDTVGGQRMPPVGTKLTDDEAVKLIEEWVRRLPG